MLLSVVFAIAPIWSFAYLESIAYAQLRDGAAALTQNKLLAVRIESKNFFIIFMGLVSTH
jgi:hypothetical protein